MKPQDSADTKVKEHGRLFDMICKICKERMGSSEHARMNMGICLACTPWYHRQQFALKKWNKRNKNNGDKDKNNTTNSS